MRLPTFAVVLSLFVTGCLGAAEVTPEDAATPGPGVAGADEERLTAIDFAGVLTGTPVMPALNTHPFMVPGGVLAVQVLLNWTTPVAELNFSIVDAQGEQVGVGFKETDTSRAVATVHPPAEGEWTLFIGSTRSANEAYKAKVTIVDAVPGFKDIKDTYRAPVGKFAEVNLIMEANQTFDYAWVVEQAGNPMYFNIHSHQDGQTVRHVEETAESGSGRFTAPSREVYSLLWRNSGAIDLDVALDLSGEFRMHSETHHS